MGSKTLISGTGYDIKGGKTLISGTGYAIKQGKTLINGIAKTIDLDKPITSVNSGETVPVAENGSPVDYIVVQIGTPNTDYYQNADGYWLLRKNLDSTMHGYYNCLHNNRDDFDYDYADYRTATKENDIQTNEQKFYNRYGPNLKSIIMTPTLPFEQGSNSIQLTVKNVFHLGVVEVRASSSGSNQTVLSYFKNAKLAYGYGYGDGPEPLRIAYHDGIAGRWHTRDAMSGTVGAAMSISAYGNWEQYVGGYYRPCIIVPKTITLGDLLS